MEQTIPNNGQTSLQESIEEIDASADVKPKSTPSRVATHKAETLPNPLTDDPYEWEKCTVTVIYRLLPDQTVSISVHNHKDEPIVKTFEASEVPLPEKITRVVTALKSIWPDSAISATVVLMPTSAEAAGRNMVVSVRAGSNTPVVQTGVESDLPFPAQINAMLEELKALLPTRALKHIEKDAKGKIAPTPKPEAKALSKPAIKPTTAAPVAVNKTQLSLF